LRTQDRNALNLAKALSDALNMEASVGDIPIANTMEIDVVSKHLNAQISIYKSFPIHPKLEVNGL